MVEDTKDQVINKRFDSLRPVVKAGTGWNYVSARARQSQHILEVNRIVRGFAWHQYQSAPLLERHVCRAMDQICSSPGSNRTKRAHRAGYDHHSLLLVGT